VWAWRRGVGVVVALNLSDDDNHLEGIEGRGLLATDRGRQDMAVSGTLNLAPWEGVIVDVR
jgi:hypothetical protein